MPSSPELPSLWRDEGGDIRRLNLTALDEASTKLLTQLCDDYLNNYLDNNSECRVIVDSRAHQRALHLLALRRRECLPWARQLLSHSDYVAREDGASLIMQVAEAHQLGPDEEAVGEELVALALRPPAEDNKEAQAATVALSALSVIGGEACMRGVCGVLSSSDWDQDDNQWFAAEILAEKTGQPFMEAEDLVSAAKKWVKSNREK